MGKENKYKYPESEKIYIIDYVNENVTVFFKCGHWCTDNVFNDCLINIKTGLAKWQIPEQLTLF